MYIIPYYLFQECIICYYRGKYYESNNIIMPISQKSYEEYLKLTTEIKKSCCFDYWYSKYNKKDDYIISINNNILNDINKDILKNIYIKEVGDNYHTQSHLCKGSAIMRRVKIIPFLSKFKCDDIKPLQKVLTKTCTNITNQNSKIIYPSRKKNIYDIQYNTLKYISKTKYSNRHPQCYR